MTCCWVSCLVPIALHDSTVFLGKSCVPSLDHVAPGAISCVSAQLPFVAAALRDVLTSLRLTSPSSTLPSESLCSSLGLAMSRESARAVSAAGSAADDASSDEELPGHSNMWCPLLEAAYHHSIGALLVGQCAILLGERRDEEHFNVHIRDTVEAGPSYWRGHALWREWYLMILLPASMGGFPCRVMRDRRQSVTTLFFSKAASSQSCHIAVFVSPVVRSSTDEFSTLCDAHVEHERMAQSASLQRRREQLTDTEASQCSVAGAFLFGPTLQESDGSHCRRGQPLLFGPTLQESCGSHCRRGQLSRGHHLSMNVHRTFNESIPQYHTIPAGPTV